MLLSNCRVVLVRPQFAGNVGAAARAMRNFGLVELVLVAPDADPTSSEAQRLAAHGEDVLARARVVDSLDEAVADCSFVAATSARTGGLVRRQSVGPPDQVLPLLAAGLSASPAALVFGPERDGLTDDEVTRCHYLISIPANPAYPVLNLAQAVAVCLYELRRAWLARTDPPAAAAPPAAQADLDRKFAGLRTALEEVHFLYGPKADALMHGLRHLVTRARPTDMEVKLLHGLARQICWFARRTDNPTPPEDRQVTGG
jgi:tRNA/rRNA methyltransferase